MAETWKDTITLDWNDTVDGVVGMVVKVLTATTCARATVKTDVPLGVLVNTPKATVGGVIIDKATVMLMPAGKVVKALAGGTIAVNDIVACTAAGVVTTIAKAGAYVTSYGFIIGRALTAAVISEIVELQALTCECDV